MKRLILALSLLTPLKVFPQQVEWASAVLGFSSQTSEKVYSASQALGKPSKLPLAGRTTCAWSPKPSNNLLTEYIHVSFKEPLVAKQVLVAENYNPGHIQSIYIFDSLLNGTLVYSRKAPESTPGPGRLFSLQLGDLKKKVFSVKLIMDEADQFNTYQIDAIGISSSADPVVLSVNSIDALEKYNAENLGTNINSEFDEICPIISPDGKRLYFDRKYYPGNLGEKKSDDIWYSEFSGTGWSLAKNPGGPLNNEETNFLCSISPDGNYALLGGAYGGTGPGVALATRVSSGWGVPQNVKIRNFVNVNTYNEFNLGSDGTTLTMSIENSESFGLRDIYVSFLQGDGTFSTPKNLRNIINTAGDEMSPFLAADGKTLYFSSNGHPGFGGPDIFMSKRLDDSWTNWSEPENLGNTVNSPEYEVYYSIDAKGEYAYFSSSYTSKTNLDIFRIKLPPQAQPENIVWLKGTVTDRTTGKIIPARVEIYNLNDSLLVGYSSTTETSSYAILLPGESARRVRITSDGYYGSDTSFMISGLNQYSELIRNFSLIPQKTGVIIEMKNIQFEANSSLLEDTSYAELDKVVLFLKENPKVQIEVRGHTNGLCGDEYCNSLSQKRARAVADYFISKGIAAERLTAKGYGKTIPVADNNTVEGRLKNQRVEFMITKID